MISTDIQAKPVMNGEWCNIPEKSIRRPVAFTPGGHKYRFVTGSNVPLSDRVSAIFIVIWSDKTFVVCWTVDWNEMRWSGLWILVCTHLVMNESYCTIEFIRSRKNFFLICFHTPAPTTTRYSARAPQIPTAGLLEILRKRQTIWSYKIACCLATVLLRWRRSPPSYPILQPRKIPERQYQEYPYRRDAVSPTITHDGLMLLVHYQTMFHQAIIMKYDNKIDNCGMFLVYLTKNLSCSWYPTNWNSILSGSRRRSHICWVTRSSIQRHLNIF